MEKNKLPMKNEASWLYSTAKNETINFLKRRNHNISLEDIYEIEDNNDEITNIIDKESYEKRMSGLTDKEKEIISLKVLANLSFDEIGKMLEIPTGTVKWKYYKSLHTLEILLSNWGMFIITAILGVLTFKNQKKAIVPTKPETNRIEDEQYREDVSQTPSKDETKKEGNTVEEENSKTEENIVENVVEIPKNSNEHSYLGLSFMGISTVFFITTIIFSIIFTKHQLKARKKLSK